MQFFRTEWTTDEDRAIEGQSPYELPLVTCPYCQNFRGMPDICYPWVDVHRVVDKVTAKKLRCGDSSEFTWQEFKEIQARFRKLIEPPFPLPPCAKFGLFQGKLFAKPPVTEFIMPGSGILLAHRSVIGTLNALGNNLTIFEVKLKDQKTNEDIVQVWAPPVATSGNAARIKWCDHCDRGSIRQVDVVGQASVPPGTHLFVLRDSPYYFILSEKLVRDIQVNAFRGLTYRPILTE